MSFSVTFSRAELLFQESGGQWARWTRSASIAEARATSAGRVNLTATVQTYTCYSSNNYSWPVTDTITCSGQSESPKTIHAQYSVPGGITYTTTFDVPVGWIGKDVQIRIAGFTTTTKFNATEVTPSTITASNGVFGSAIPIQLNPAVSGVTHTVKVTCANIETSLLTDSTATSVNWTPSVATYAPLITSSSSTSATISCTTKNGGSTIGTTTAPITVSFAANTIPPAVSSGWATASPMNEGAVSGLTVYVQGYSKAQVTFDSSKISPQYNTTISSYSISCNGVTDSSSPYYTDVLPGTTASIACSVTDARGQKTTQNLAVNLLSYRDPWVSSVSIFRCDSEGVQDDSGTSLSIRAVGNYTPLINGSSVDENYIYSMTAAIRTSAGSYGTAFNITSGQAEVVHNMDPDVSYYVKITITDRLRNSAYVEQAVPTQAWAMKFRPTGNGVGFGKAPEADKAIEIPSDWTLKIGTNDLLTIISNKCIELLTNKVYPVGSIYMSTSSTSPGTFLGGTWERIEDRFLLAAGTTYSAGSTGGAASVTLTEAQMPSHTHTLYKGGSVLGIGVTHDAETTVGWATGATFNDRSKAATNIAPTGSGNAHENMPPYLTVYVWKRTA